ncbi:hypothetical protein QOT17_005132 [Balamuthia mandrillaris]
MTTLCSSNSLSIFDGKTMSTVILKERNLPLLTFIHSVVLPLCISQSPNETSLLLVKKETIYLNPEIGAKAYCLYNKATKSIVVSKDVTFVESNPVPIDESPYVIVYPGEKDDDDVPSSSKTSASPVQTIPHAISLNSVPPPGPTATTVASPHNDAQLMDLKGPPPLILDSSHDAGSSLSETLIPQSSTLSGHLPSDSDIEDEPNSLSFKPYHFIDDGGGPSQQLLSSEFSGSAPDDSFSEPENPCHLN